VFPGTSGDQNPRCLSVTFVPLGEFFHQFPPPQFRPWDLESGVFQGQERLVFTAVAFHFLNLYKRPKLVSSFLFFHPLFSPLFLWLATFDAGVEDLPPQTIDPSPLDCPHFPVLSRFRRLRGDFHPFL